MKLHLKSLFLLLFLLMITAGYGKQKPYFKMRGAVLSVPDLETADWPRIAFENGINTLGTHITPDEVLRFWESEKGRKFQADCRKYGIEATCLPSIPQCSE